MGGTVVGVDIGDSSIRAVEVQGYEGAKPSILRFGQVPLPENAVRRGEVIEGATVATALRRLWSVGGFKTKDVVLGMGGTRVFARDFSVPRGTLSEIRESLPFLVQEQLPIPVSDALLDFYPVSEEAGENGPLIAGLLVAGVNESVTANVSATLSAGLRPLHVDLVPFAVSRALAPVRSARGRDAVVDIGASATNVVIVHDGVPNYVRIIPNGADDVTRAIATRLQWSPEQAEQAKRAIGMGGAMLRQEDRPVLEIIYEAVGELLGAVRSTLTYYATARPAEPVQRILLSGGGARLGGLSNALAELTGIAVMLAEPLASVSMSRTARGRTSREEQDAFTTAYGLALGSHA